MSDIMSPKAHAGALMTLGLPLVGSHLAQMLLHVTDTVMMGWYGVAELAAMVLGGATFFIIFILGSGFAQAVMPMVAQAVGRGDEVQVRRDTRMGLWLSIIYGVICYPLFWWSGALLHLLGQTPEVTAFGQDFLRIAGLGMIPALLVMVLKSYLAALERTQVVLWVTLAGVGVNAALCWALIFGNWGAPELGVRGAAVASVSVQIFTAALLAIYAGWLPELRRFHLFQRFWRPDWLALRRMFWLGMPIGLTSLAEGGMFHASALMMGWIGTVELASHGIAMQAASLTFMVHLGLSNATTVRTALAAGANDIAFMRTGAKVAIVLSMGFALTTVALFLLLPGPIIKLFLDATKAESAQIVLYATSLLAVAALFQCVDALQVMALGLLRGIKDTRVPMAIAAFSYWVIGVPSSYLLAFKLNLGGVGLWLGLVLGLSVAAMLLMIRFWRRVALA